MWLRVLSCFMREQSSNPSIPGIATSETTASMCSLPRISRASAALLQVRTLKRRDMMPSKSSVRSSLSSTNSTTASLFTTVSLSVSASGIFLSSPALSSISSAL